MELYSIYHQHIPQFINEFAHTPAMLRLKDIGMNCGCEYTQFELFQNIYPYSRYEHSIGVALIIWHFTHDKKQAIAGLLHDIATPVFAHTIDFLNGDYQKQESTENRTQEMIENSFEIQDLLHKYHLQTSDVSNYHLYPIADNCSPQLSADRLEYTLSNLIYYHFDTLSNIQRYYNDLTIVTNEFQEHELAFQTPDIAIAFSEKALLTSQVYICDTDRFAMQSLSLLLKQALQYHALTQEDFYTTETQVIHKLQKHPILSQHWQTYTHYSQILTATTPPHDSWFQVSAKKRYINPLVHQQRVSDISSHFYTQLQDFLNIQFNHYLSAQ